MSMYKGFLGRPKQDNAERDLAIMKMRASGVVIGQIAKAFNMSPGRVSQICGSNNMHYKAWLEKHPQEQTAA